MSELTNGQKEDFLRAAIKAELVEADDDGYCWCYVADWTDSWVVYECNGGYFEVAYSMDAAGGVTFTGEPKAKVPQTTYVDAPDDDDAERALRASMERRGVGTVIVNVASGADPEAISDAVRRAGSTRPAGGARVTSEPLTYHQRAPHSFYRDLLLSDRVPGAPERLQRHRQEMDVVAKEREARAERQLRAGGFESRVTPNTNDGTGGYFAIPLWLNDLFATAKRPGRVLANLIPGQFPLPQGVSSINLPILTTGTDTAPVVDDAAVPDQDITDAAGSSVTATFAGTADVALQLLEQSPAGAHVDWALFRDLSEDYDQQLEYALCFGVGSSATQLLGLFNISGINTVTYTDSGPTAKALYPYLGQMTAKIGNNRFMPPEAWLMRTARWSWLTSSEDTADRPLEFPTLNGDDNPKCPGAPLGWPGWLSDSIPATITSGGVVGGGAADTILACRPSDMFLLEGSPQTSVMRDVLSGTLGARIQMHNSAAFIGNRYPSGISRLIGTGMAVVSAYAS